MPHPQPGSAPPAGTAEAEPVESGATRSDDHLTASDRDADASARDSAAHRSGRPGPYRAAAASDRTAAGLSCADGNTAPQRADPLDAPGSWPAVPTGAGLFRLVPVGLPGDLPLLTGWMNDPVVAAFWELPGPERVTEAHVRPQLDGDGRSAPCLGVLDGVPMSYWELYRADLDPLAQYCRVGPHDTGVHLLLGGTAHRGRGLGTLLLRTVADLVLAQRPRCMRVLAEPDVRNAPSLAAFLGAGFRRSAEIELPGKRAALMVRDREPRRAR
ncbi:GNAT family N-acetyltransferase [Streptomyces sp. WMMB303]|uniref:GNAT family N-acetyltransferase n=1 Tax=unclassified Streptomyces TaxID=2593676 RepID=UPI0023EDF70B|nr:GNAT family N-acetyltransferase [Streptomyces sp. WMMB303]MDF4253040.1 GNAT family N-acetyltransferase [Streptomyces sp. WMMB303]